MRAPEAYIEWINKHIGFNPRSQANSDALSDLVVADLQSSCGLLGSALGSGELRQGKNPNVQTKAAERSIDLVIYETIAAPLISVRVSVEHKTIMTAHGKARKNRYGDIIAYSNHMHNHRRDCIAGAIVVINISPKYENPDDFAKGLQRPDYNMEKIVKDTVNVFSRIPLRNGPDDPSDQPEALAIILVDYDGVSPGKLVPGPGGSVEYEGFIERICTLYERRFSVR